MAKQITSAEIVENDIFRNLRESAEKTLKDLGTLNEELKETASITETQLKKGFGDSTKALNDFINATERARKIQAESVKIDKQEIQLKQQIQKLKQEENKAAREAANAKKAETQAKAAARRETEAEAKAAARAAKAAADQKSQYKQLVKSTRDLKNESKELAAQMINLEAAGKKNSKEYRQLSLRYKEVTKSAQAADQQLKNIDKAVGDNFRNVGNYTQVLGKMRSALGSLGLAFGGFQVIKGAGETIANFEQSMANLSSITGATGDDLKALENAAIELGGKTTLSASQVAEGFKLIGSAKPELLENKEALIQVTDAGIMLAEAAGITLPEAAAALTNTLNQFGAGADEAAKFVDVLAAGSKFGAGDINFLNAAMEKAGSVAKAAGLDIRETGAALEVLAKSGVPAEKAGTDFRNILLKLQAAGIGFVDGQFEIKEALEQSKDMLAAIEDPAERAAKAQKLFGSQSIASAEFMMENISLYEELNEKMDENGIAAEQQRTNTETLQGAISILKSKWEEFILKLNQGAGIADILRNAVLFLANNLNKIVYVVGLVIKGFIAFKAAQIAIIARQKILNAQMLISQKGLKGFLGGLLNGVKGMLGMAKGMKGAGTAARGFGTALKSIPFVAIIGAVLELASALWDFVSGADEAEAAAARLEDIKNKRIAKDEAAAESAEQNRQDRQRRMQAEFEEIERKRREAVADGAKTQKIADAEALQAKKNYLQTLKDEIREEHKSVAVRFQAAKKVNEFIKSDAFGKAPEAVKFWGTAKSLREGQSIFLQAGNAMKETFTSAGDAMIRSGVVMKQAEAETERMNAELKNLNNLQKDVNLEEKEANAGSRKAAAKRLREIRTEFSNQIDLLEELNKLQAEYNDLQKDLADIGRDAALSEITRNLKAEEEAIKNASERGAEIDLTNYRKLQEEKLRISLEQIEADKKADIQAVNDKYDAVFKAQEKRLKDERDRLIKNAKGNTAKIQEIEDNFAIEMEKLDTQKIAAAKVRDTEIQNIEIEAAIETSETRIKIEENTQETINKIRAKAINDRFDRELKSEELRLLRSGAKKEDIQAALDLKEIALLEKKIAEKNKLGLDTLDDEIQLAKKRQEVNEKAAKDAAEAEAEAAENRIAIAKALTDAFIEQSNKRIEAIDKEIAAAEKQADYFRDLAAQGNITAKESLAEQNKIIAEANERKRREQLRQERAQFALAIYESYQRNAADESVKNPVAKTITDAVVLSQFIQSFVLPTFEKGTEDTGLHGAGVDGKGGFHAILHPRERVLTKEQNSRIGNISNEDLSRMAMEYNAGRLISAGDAAEQIGGAWSIGILANKLDSIERVIAEKPETNIELGEIIGGTMQIVKSTRKGNTSIYNRYRIKR